MVATEVGRGQHRALRFRSHLIRLHRRATLRGRRQLRMQRPAAWPNRLRCHALDMMRTAELRGVVMFTGVPDNEAWLIGEAVVPNFGRDRPHGQ